MSIAYSKYAEQELLDAIDFYECEHTGLGREFKAEVKQASIRISNHPLAWSVEQGDIRKCLLHKFPYKILYSIEANDIFVIAIAHQHRKPDYWQS
ncbi:hypothetical protein SPBRAN_616 [uncultured Candidatus Thioglobus sp.]|nr:hypothetical protein SPBRAN_616 [uncultured Candidatus Thioglobus sp.]